MPPREEAGLAGPGAPGATGSEAPGAPDPIATRPLELGRQPPPVFPPPDVLAGTSAGSGQGREAPAGTGTTAQMPVVPPGRPPPGQRPPGDDFGDGSRRGLLLGGLGVALLALVAAGLLIGGVFSSGSNAASKQANNGGKTATHSTTTHSTTVTTTTTTTAATSTPTTTTVPNTTTFAGDGFTIGYPANWTVVTNQKHYSWGTDTTIVSPQSPKTLLRVDVTPNLKSTDPLTSWQAEINAVSKEPGYSKISLRSNRVDGDPGERWEFLVLENGQLLHKVDEFIVTPQETGFAVLTQAPVSQYASLAGQFASLRKTLSLS